jgi:hypothetical protein
MRRVGQKPRLLGPGDTCPYPPGYTNGPVTGASVAMTLRSSLLMVLSGNVPMSIERVRT